MSLIGGILAVGLGIFANTTEQKFERQAAEQIKQEILGEEAECSVNIRPAIVAAAWGELDSARITASKFSLQQTPIFQEPSFSQSGKIGSLEFRLSDFTLRGLRINQLEVDIPGCRYDFGVAKRTKQIRISRSGVGTGKVEVLAEDLANYIVHKFAEVKECTVQIRNGFLWVEGYGEFLIVKTKFAVIARLESQDGHKLMLTQPKVYFDWTRAEPTSAKLLVDALNPIIDLDEDLRLFGALYVNQLELEDGKMIATGDAKIPVNPNDLPADNQY
ncbi:MAG: hypothetical protein KDC26_06020 [Armatimonadetes bacterium]|nr:hypothetical protein [Armatimonadota bacterium]